MLLVILAIAFVLLFVWGMLRRFSFSSLLKMAFNGVKMAWNMVFVMLLVGAMTALWRADGTIAYIVSAASDALLPSVFLPIAFLLCVLVSVLTGTSVGTAATIGVICISVGRTLGIDVTVVGGTCLAGAYFGDRCSPVSTSALLTAQVTETNIYSNIQQMIRTSIVPFAIALALYFIVGNFYGAEGNVAANVQELFEKYLHLHPATLLPAMAILVLSIFRVNVKITMAVSILISAVLCVVLQNMTVLETFKTALFGYDAPAEIQAMLGGGGTVGMLKIVSVVLLAMMSAGIFRGTNLLRHVYIFAESISKKTNPYACTVLIAIATVALSCNQTVSIVLTNDICRNVEPDNSKRAIYVENSSVIIAPLIPWSMAGVVPLAAMEAPTSSILFAFYLFLIPLVNLIVFPSKSYCTNG